jgi:hypothetical protein
MATVTPVWSYGRSTVRHTEVTVPGDETAIWSYGVVVLAAQADLLSRIAKWLPAFISRRRH